jgi:hypothetical protein
VVVVAHGRAQAQSEHSQIGVGLTHEFGVFMISHTKVAVSASRNFFGRLHLGANAAAGVGPDVLVHEETVQAGLVLHPSERVDFLMAWRLGYAYFSLTTAADDLGIHTLTFEPILRIDYQVRDDLEITLAPFVLSGFWSHAWGTNIAVELELAYRF